MAHLTVQPGQRAVVRRNGTVVAVHGPGRHRLPQPFWRRTVRVLDVRSRVLQITNQEVLTADVPGLKMSVAATWAIADPALFLEGAEDPADVLRLALQLALRDWVAQRTLESVVGERLTAGQTLVPQAQDAVTSLGLVVRSVAIRDIVLPGEVRRAALTVTTARQEGLAALERARAEISVLRALANGAKLLEDHPRLAQLRLAEAVAGSGGTVDLTIQA